MGEVFGMGNLQIIMFKAGVAVMAAEVRKHVD
jgi:hypothetical protein